MPQTTVDRPYEAAASLIRVHGILSIIFGGLGILTGVFFGLMMALVMIPYDNYQWASGVITAFCVFVFFVLPHVYLLIAGIHLIKNPTPVLAKTLVIINLVVGVFYNVVLLIFAIINLVQFADYEHGYKHHKA